jgi:phosphatidylinositol alpha-1,6-mannosyltransferase
MWFARRILFPLSRRRPPVLYFCFEPPRFVYSDTSDVAGRVGRLGTLVVVLAFLYRFVDRRMVRSADRVLSNSPYGARRIRKAYGRRATVIEHGVDFAPPAASDVEHLRARYGLEGRSVAVTVNHLHPRKRIDLFLRAVAEARKAAPSLAALVVGGGPEREALQSLASELGLRPGADAIFTGAVPEALLPAHYALADVYVHTGREESFGLSVIEALYSGVPVVSVNEGGPCDTVHDGWSGYLVDSDAAALGEKIALLINDSIVRDEMGAHGAEFVRRHFRWERGAETILNVLGMVSRQLAARRAARIPRLRATR